MTQLLKWRFVFLIGIISLTLYFCLQLFFHQELPSVAPAISGSFFLKPQAISNFKLTNNVGSPFSKQDLKGHWSLVYFGFTHCAKICPITLSTLASTYKQLQHDLPAKDLPSIVFISLDPARDTLKRINEYVTAFHPHFIGVRGEMSETAVLMKQLQIFAAKLTLPNRPQDQYQLTHTNDVFVFRPDAKLQAFLSYPPSTEQLIKDYKSILQYAAKHERT